MLFIGLVSGVLLAALYFGAKSGDGARLGSGLKALIEQRWNRAASRPTEPPISTPVERSAPTAKFDFYTVLPEIERVMPDDFEDSGRDVKNDSKPGVFMLQAASYENFEDADRLKAKLALSGFESSVQKVSIQGKGIYYRVRLGPYTSKRRLKNDKQRLAKLGVSSMALRLTTQ